jgi:cob(I)alamin adenosyltransferase
MARDRWSEISEAAEAISVRHESRTVAAKNIRDRLQRMTHRLIQEYPDDADLIMFALEGCVSIAHNRREAQRRAKREAAQLSLRFDRE